MRYPQQAKRDSVEGKVYISLWVNINDTTSHHKVLHGVNKDLNTEAMRVTKLIKFEKSAMKKGKAVRTRNIVPADFMLE